MAGLAAVEWWQDVCHWIFSEPPLKNTCDPDLKAVKEESMVKGLFSFSVSMESLRAQYKSSGRSIPLTSPFTGYSCCSDGGQHGFHAQKRWFADSADNFFVGSQGVEQFIQAFKLWGASIRCPPFGWLVTSYGFGSKSQPLQTTAFLHFSFCQTGAF